MICWARFATGKCWHATDLKWKYQRHFITFCGAHKDYPQLFGGKAHTEGRNRHLAWMDDKGVHCAVKECELNISHWRKCKSCKRAVARHLKRSRGLNLDLSKIQPWLEMPRGINPPSSP